MSRAVFDSSTSNRVTRQTVTLPVADVRDLIAAARNAALSVGVPEVTRARASLFRQVRVIEAQIGLQTVYQPPAPAPLPFPRISPWRVFFTRAYLSLRHLDAALFGHAGG